MLDLFWCNLFHLFSNVYKILILYSLITSLSYKISCDDRKCSLLAKTSDSQRLEDTLFPTRVTRIDFFYTFGKSLCGKTHVSLVYYLETKLIVV